MMRKLLLVIWLAFAAPLFADLYVDGTAADDTGDGSVGSPTKTIVRAIGLTSPGTTIIRVVTAGTYNETTSSFGFMWLGASGVTNITDRVLTIKNDSGGTVTLTADNSTRIVLIGYAGAIGTTGITFDGITFSKAVARQIERVVDAQTIPITLLNCVMTTSTDYNIYCSTAAGQFTLTNCTLTSTDATDGGNIIATTFASLTMTNCTLTAAKYCLYASIGSITSTGTAFTAGVGAAFKQYSGGFAAVSVTGGSMAYSAAYGAIDRTAASTSFTLDGVAFSCPATGAVYSVFNSTARGGTSSDVYDGPIIVRNCTGTVPSFVAIPQAAKSVEIYNNTITNNDTQSRPFIYVGLEITISGGDHAVCPVGPCRVEGNTFTADATATHHGHWVLFASGSQGVFRGNRIIDPYLNNGAGNFSQGVNIKACNVVVENNYIYMPTGDTVLYFTGAVNVMARRNTIIGSTKVVNVDAHQDYANATTAVITTYTTGTQERYPFSLYGLAYGNECTDNIIVATGASPYDGSGAAGTCVAFGTNGMSGSPALAYVAWRNRFDHNLYWSMGTGDKGMLVTPSGTTNATTTDAASIALLTAAWAAYSSDPVTKLNDANSHFADPQFKSISTGDLKIPFTSPALNIGYPGSATFGYRNVGAYQHKALPPRR